jgi:hypothetical protein
MRRSAIMALAALVCAVTPVGAAAHQNGFLPQSALAPAAQGGCVKLERDAARAWNALQVSVGKVLPANGCDSAYRPYRRQVYWRNVWCGRGQCGNAAVPGFSNHGIGRAIDIPAWVRTIVDRIGWRYGWCKTGRWVRGGRVWCVSDAPQESWHVRYTPGVWTGGLPNLPVLHEGMRRREVKTLNRRLRAHSTSRYCRGARGVQFGVRTRRCAIRFQTHHRLAGDGIVGPGTWKRLIAHRKVQKSRPRR